MMVFLYTVDGRRKEQILTTDDTKQYLSLLINLNINLTEKLKEAEFRASNKLESSQMKEFHKGYIEQKDKLKHMNDLKSCACCNCTQILQSQQSINCE